MDCAIDEFAGLTCYRFPDVIEKYLSDQTCKAVQTGDDALISNLKSNLKSNFIRSRQARRPRRWLKMLSILDHYLLGHIVTSTLMGLAWFMGILLVVVVITAVQKVVSNALSFSQMAWFVAFQVPRMVLFALPMSVLFGSVQAFAALSKQGEITALHAAGVSLPRLLRAPVIWSVALAGVTFILQEWVVPPMERNKDAMLVSYIQKAVTESAGFRFEDPPSERGPLKTVIQAAQFDFTNQTLTRPRIQLYNDDHQMTLQISAERAEWRGGKWILFDGKTIRLSEDESGGIITTRFNTLEAEIPPPAFMRRAATTLQKRLQQGDFLMVSIPQVSRYRQQLFSQLPEARKLGTFQSTWRLIKSATFGIHDKLATPLICLAFVLVGVPLGTRSQQRGGGGGAFGLSLVVLMLYYVLWTWASTLGRAGVANPLLMAYLALALVSSIGVFLVWRHAR